VEKEYEDIEKSLSLRNNETPRKRMMNMFFFFPPVHLRNKLKEEFVNGE
jgi:hypothetical protein